MRQSSPTPRRALQALCALLFVAALPAVALAKRDVGAAVSRDLLKPWVERYERTSKVARSRQQGKRPDGYAMRVFMLERELTDMIQYVNARKDLTRGERQVVSSDIRSWFGRLQHSYTTLQSTMRAQTEANHPGSTGTTKVERARVKGQPTDLYAPSYHTKQPLSKAEQRRRYESIVAKRQLQHPGRAPYLPLTRKNLLAVPSGELREVTVTQGGNVRMTSFAKHADVNGGGRAQSAGGFKVYWGREAGKKVPLLVPLSNWSGTYQPDMASVAPTVSRRLRNMGIPDNVVVYTANEAVSPKMFEILQQGRGIDKAVAKARGARLERIADKRGRAFSKQWNQAISSHTVKRNSAFRHRGPNAKRNSVLRYRARRPVIYRRR